MLKNFRKRNQFPYIVYAYHQTEIDLRRKQLKSIASLSIISSSSFHWFKENFSRTHLRIPIPYPYEILDLLFLTRKLKTRSLIVCKGIQDLERKLHFPYVCLIHENYGGFSIQILATKFLDSLSNDVHTSMRLQAQWSN